MRRIILIGGGEIKDRETFPIDQQFLRLSGGKNAVIGFFPTAAGDSDEYIKTFTAYYQALGCLKVVPVKLGNLSLKKCKKLINKMTGIYLGGGATSALIESFKKKGVDILIKNAVDNGVVVAGMSAGALAACDYYFDPDIKSKKQKIKKGLGLQNMVLCAVHYQKRKDKSTLYRFKKGFPDYKALGIEEKRAVLIEGEKIRWLC